MLTLVSEKTQSLKEFTENHYAQGAFFWRSLLKNKNIKVNGKKVGQDVRLYAGDMISYYLTAAQESKSAYHILYEDGNVLVVDKESGVNSEAVFAAISRERECHFIHRLDRNTQGILLFALNEKTETILLEAFKQRRVEKIYYALCFGSFPKGRDVMTAYLKKDESRSLVKIFDQKTSGAEQIVTEYNVLKRSAETTKAEITLHTGKTHQIRAHLAHIGCPIVGDMKYGNSAKNKALNVARQRLVAKRLRLFLDGEWAYLNEKEFCSNFDVEEDTER